MKRLAILGAVLATALTATPAHAATALELPAPTGTQGVGTTSLHLVDTTRKDPLAPTVRDRELMVRLWYPAQRRGPRAGYVSPTQSALLVGFLNDQLGTTLPDDLLTFPTHSRQDARPLSRHPLLLFSPGLGVNAALYTGIFEELASRGYVVAAVDHTFDAPFVEFPGGRIEPQNPEALKDFDRLLAVRTADMRFVLTQLSTGPFSRNIDLSRVGVFGHSMGSITAVRTMNADRRFHAGTALDGNPLGSASLDRPFLLLGNQNHRRVDDRDWADFYDRLRGPRLHLVVQGALHYDFTDVTIFKSVVDVGKLFEVGPIDGERSLTIERRYVTAWFDKALRGKDNPLLCGESPRFREVDFQP
ncbi:hypothetical protein [Lentzea sp. NBRC 105346]|uniref:alpha/beta hydrolase family protein n=1 Tax=Lentzea sp. NBRC 105346 TaxID=3032205 RepID=UPI002555EC50|nr:hypothetical protein [Lentzea sp. NBRC 105346]